MTIIKNAIKRFTAISMTIVLLSCSLPVSAYAGETFEPEAVSEALEESIPEEVLVNVSEEDNKEVVLVEGLEGDNRENTPDEDSEEDTQDDLLPEPACPKEICNDGNYDSTSSENTCPAMIGDTAYDSIQEAFDAANDGDTVKLCDYITTTETITVNNGAQDMPISLDLNGHGILMTGDDRVITVGKNGFFVLKDSTSKNAIHRITLDSSGKGIIVFYLIKAPK